MSGMTAGNPLGAMALASLVLLSGMFLAPRLFRQVKRGGERTAERLDAAADAQRMAPGTGMGTNHAGGHMGALAMIAAVGTLNSSPVGEWLLGGINRPLSPKARRLMTSQLNSAESQQRLSLDRDTLQAAIDRRLSRGNLRITDPLGVANATDTLVDMGISPANIAGALKAAGAREEDVNRTLRARADLFADTYTQRNLNIPVQRYLAGMRHVEGKQRVSDNEFDGYLSVASVVASNFFSKAERPLYELPVDDGTPTVDRFKPYLDPKYVDPVSGTSPYSPYVETLIKNSENRVTLHNTLVKAGPDFYLGAAADQRNAVAAYWSREAQDSARAWFGNPDDVAARDRVLRARESIRNIELELGPLYASPFSP